MNPPDTPCALTPAWLVVFEPSGNRQRVRVDPLPFSIGRHRENHLVLADARISRNHARILSEGPHYVIEDLGSTNGLFVNGERVSRKSLRPYDGIEFGAPGSFRLVFETEDVQLPRLAARVAAAPGSSGELARLEAIVQLARALETAISTTDVLAALVDAALAVSRAERGFLLLGDGKLQVRVARNSRGEFLDSSELRVPLSRIEEALGAARGIVELSFDTQHSATTTAELRLASAVCLPLVRIRSLNETKREMIGALYLESRTGAADLAAGGRELLQALALEASTVIEIARLLEGERERRRLEEELRIARLIQQSLLSRDLPSSGWLRALGRSLPCYEVGGDYFDLRRISPESYAVILADVAGKGTSSALLAALLQGVFLVAWPAGLRPAQIAGSLNSFLLERTGGEKFATIFLGTICRDGRLEYVNAGHGGCLLVRRDGRLEQVEANCLPVGMLEEATYESRELRLAGGDKLIIYTDGLTEARNSEGEFFGERGIQAVARAAARGSISELADDLGAALEAHTCGAVQTDDVSFLILDYCAGED